MTDKTQNRLVEKTKTKVFPAMDEHRPLHTKQKKTSSGMSTCDKAKQYTKIKKRSVCPLSERPKNQSEEERTGKSRLLTDFKTIQIIGKGGFGKVIEAKNEIDNCVYAIKIIKFNRMENKTNTIKEAKLLSQLNHDNIVRYYSAWIDEIEETADSQGTEEDMSYTTDSNGNSIISPGTLYEELNTPPSNGRIQVLCIQMQFCKTTLQDAINNNLWRDHSEAWRMFWEIVEGLVYLHGISVIHRDLKPDNIFLDAQGRIKIGDFGLATNMHRDTDSEEQLSQSKSGIGTIYYRAPELDNSECRSMYGQEVDMYSLGIVLFEMFSPPLNTAHERYVIMTQLRSPDILMPNEFLDDCKNTQPIYLLRLLLSHDYKSRPTSNELLNYLSNNLQNINVTTDKMCPLQIANAFCNKIQNIESENAFSHSI